MSAAEDEVVMPDEATVPDEIEGCAEESITGEAETPRAPAAIDADGWERDSGDRSSTYDRKDDPHDSPPTEQSNELSEAALGVDLSSGADADPSTERRRATPDNGRHQGWRAGADSGAIAAHEDTWQQQQQQQQLSLIHI